MADPENVADNTGDIVVTDQQLFDHAISDTPAAEPAAPIPAPSPAPAPQQPSQQPTPPRDEQGRFAPRQGQPPQQQQPQAAPQQRQPEDHRVPLRELLDERERRQRVEAEANQMRQAWAQWQQMQAQQAAEAAQQQAPQTIFDNPDDYLNQRVMNPLRQEGQMYMLQVKDGMSREMANMQFGEQAVNAALQDMIRVRHTPQGDFVFNQIMQAGHPYAALVKWHNTARAQQAIGPDPHAWLQQKQQEWVKDPKAQQAVLQHLPRETVLQYFRQQQQASGRPPNVSLPPSLSSMPASSGRLDDQGDMSNESLYRFATK
jgi:hypothetical protein